MKKILRYVRRRGESEYRIGVRGDVGGEAPPLREYVKTVVERRREILRCVWLGEGFENVGIETRGTSERAHKMFERLFLVNKVCENIRTWVPP